MKKKHILVSLGAMIVMICSCAVVVFLLGRTFSAPAGAVPNSSETLHQIPQNQEGNIKKPTAVDIPKNGTSLNYLKVSQAVLPEAPGCNALSVHQGRDSLHHAGMQNLYDQLSKKVYSISETTVENHMYPIERIVVFGCQLTEGQIVQTLTAFFHDHSEVFWISNQYGYSVTATRTVVQLYSVISARECEKISVRVVTEIDKILQKLPEAADALEKEIFLYRTVIEKCRYDTQGASDDADWRAHSIVGAFLDGEAVCEGYSRALQMLLNQSGISSMVVTGTANGAHMWNLIRIDGQWYHADATWDDNGEEPLYRYFNLTDQMMSKDHEMYPQAEQEQLLQGNQVYNLPLPSCTAVKANYFRSQGVHISSMKDTNTLESAIENAAKNGRTTLYLYIDEKLDYKKAVSALFQKSPCRFMDAVQKANLEMKSKIKYDDCTYMEADVSRGIVVFLSYEKY